MNGPLDSVRVLDMTSVVMGPYASQILGEYGADVVKVEPPQGDVMRLSGPMRNPKMGHLYMSTNRAKRSVIIDLKTDEGRTLLLELAANFDVLIYNIRPQAMARLGLSYDDVAVVNPEIIYVGAYGFSQRGPYAARPAYDDLIQGMAGVPWLSMQAGANEPHYAPMILADRMVGLQTVAATISALFHRERTGRGQRLDIPMFEGLASVVLAEHLAGAMFDPPEGPSGYQRSLSRNRKPFRTQDGYLCTLIYTDKQWRAFFKVIGEPDKFDADARFSSQSARLEHIDAVYGYLADCLATGTTTDWVERLVAADIPAAPMNSIPDILDDEHLRSIGFFRHRDHPSEGPIIEMAVPTEWSDTPPGPTRPAPRPGEQTKEVLMEAGFDKTEIDALEARGIISWPSD